jgi:hypothetical protein
VLVLVQQQQQQRYSDLLSTLLQLLISVPLL